MKCNDMPLAGRREQPRQEQAAGPREAKNMGGYFFPVRPFGQDSSGIITVITGSPLSPGPHKALSRTRGGTLSRLSFWTWTPKRISGPPSLLSTTIALNVGTYPPSFLHVKKDRRRNSRSGTGSFEREPVLHVILLVWRRP